MDLSQKLKQYERQVVFLRWGGSAEYGRLNYVGEDFVEFCLLDVDLMEYTETVLINTQIILEMVIGSSDISRVVAEYSSNLPSVEKE